MLKINKQTRQTFINMQLFSREIHLYLLLLYVYY